MENSKRLFSPLMLGLVAFSLLGLLLTLVLVSGTVESENADLETEKLMLDKTLQVQPTTHPEEVALQATLDEIRSDIRVLSRIRANFTDTHINWAELVNILSNYDPSVMMIDGFVQAELNLTLNGHATRESIVMDYVQMLEDSSQFDRVTVQSITLSSGSPSGRETSTPNTLAFSGGQPTFAEFTIQLVLKAKSP